MPPPAWPTCGRGLGAAGEAHSQPLPIKTWYEVKNRLLHIRIHRGAICIFYWDSYVHYLKPEKSIMGKEATSDLVRGREWGRERLGRRGGMGRDPLVLWGAVSTTCPQIIQKGLANPPAALWLLIFLNKKLRGSLYLCPSEDALIHHSQSNEGLLIVCLCVGR